MLKQRVITAIILAVVFLTALFGLAAEYFSLFIAVVVLIGAWEWANLSSVGALWQRILYVIVIAALIGFLSYSIGFCCPYAGMDNSLIKSILITACVWWVLALLLIKSYPRSAILWGHPALRLLMGCLVLVPTWVSLAYIRLQPLGEWLVLIIIAVVAVADIGGYFSGRKFGKHKLARTVSPGKTWEGFAGGLIFNLLFAVLIGYFTTTYMTMLLLVIVPTSLFSVVGDLLESMVKRHAGVKDSGVILPGHGGVLDRVDGITAAAPVFALAYMTFCCFDGESLPL